MTIEPREFAWREDEEVRFRAGGATLEGRCFGPPPARADTIVLLHEGLGSARLWRGFPAALAAATGCGVFAYSRQGYGSSDPCALPRPLDYMTDEGVRVLPEVLDAVGVRRAILLGHSDGASIASAFAGRIDDARLAGLIVMAPHYFTEPMGLASIAEAKVAYDTGDLRGRLARHHAHVDVAFRGWNDSWLHPDFVAWNIRDVLATVKVPTLAIQGVDDQYGTRAQVDAVGEDVPAPVEVVLLPDCRHSPHLDQPERTVSLVADFVAGLDRAAAAQ